MTMRRDEARARIEAGIQARIEADLRLLRETPAPATDVVARVLARVAASPAPRREEISRRELAWIATGIGAVLLGSLVTAVAQAPAILDLLERGGIAMARMRTVFAALASPAHGVLEAIGEASLRTGGACAAAAMRALGRTPALSTLAWLVLLVMVATTALVVRRDLRRERNQPPRVPPMES
jgi:hypothetical protein